MVDYQQERALAKNRIRRRGIYLLPNLFTTAALFAGFYAIVQAMNGRFDNAAIAVFAGLTMVSNLKYYSFKTINLRRSVPFVVVFLIVLFFVLVSVQPPVVLFAAFVLYGLSGYVWSAWLALKRRRGSAA